VVEYLRQVKHYQKIFVEGHLDRSEYLNICGGITGADYNFSKHCWFSHDYKLYFFKELFMVILLQQVNVGIIKSSL
jgi:hypothetical protein